jgi:hypothetical protein
MKGDIGLMRNLLRKLVVLMAALGMLTLLTGQALAAGQFIHHASQLRVSLGALATIVVPGTAANGTGATLTGDGSIAGYNVTLQESVFTTQELTIGTSLLTGVALISNLQLTATNRAVAFSGSFGASSSVPNPQAGNLTSPSSTPSSGYICPSGCLGNYSQAYNGSFLVFIINTPLPFPLDVIGAGGTAAIPLGQASIFGTGGPMVTGKVRITNITTNLISIPGRGETGVTGIGVTLNPAGTEIIRTFTTLDGFITSNPSGVLKTQASVTLGGSGSITASGDGGLITLVSPLRINTGPLGVGNIPGAFYQRLRFVQVPEPGTAMLLIAGSAGLIFIGRKRMKS